MAFGIFPYDTQRIPFGSLSNSYREQGEGLAHGLGLADALFLCDFRQARVDFLR
jgi:hypothetical protein